TCCVRPAFCEDLFPLPSSACLFPVFLSATWVGLFLRTGYPISTERHFRYFSFERSEDCQMNHTSYSPEYIKDILTEAKTVALDAAWRDQYGWRKTCGRCGAQGGDEPLPRERDAASGNVETSWKLPIRFCHSGPLL